MKKVIIITKYFYPVKGGIENGIYETYQHLLSLGWDINIYCSKKINSQSKEDLNGFKIKRFSNLSKEILRMKVEERCIYSVHNFDFSISILLLIKFLYAKKILNKQFVVEAVTHGGLATNWGIFSKFKSLIKKFVNYSLGVALVNLTADMVRCVSLWEKEQLINLGIDQTKLYVAQNGIDNVIFEHRPGHAEKENYILSISKIRPDKNIDSTIRALKYVDNNIKFIIIGKVTNVDYFIRLNKLINNKKLNDRVIFITEVSDEEKINYIKKAKLLIHLSNWENYGTTVREAMVLSTPCLINAGTAMDELVDRQIQSVNYLNNPQKLAKAINKMLCIKADSNTVKIDKENRFAVAKLINKKYLELI